METEYSQMKLPRPNAITTYWTRSETVDKNGPNETAEGIGTRKGKETMTTGIGFVSQRKAA